MKEKREIIKYHEQGIGIKEIVRLTGISRNTVRTYLREYKRLEDELNNTDDEIVQQNIIESSFP